MREFIRFCIVGGIATGIDAGLFYLSKLVMPYQAAMICSYCLSLCVNYFLTVFWTFRTRPTIANGLGIVLAHLFNLFVVRMGLMKLFIGLGMGENVAFVPTLCISIVTNYIIIRFIVNHFRK